MKCANNGKNMELHKLMASAFIKPFYYEDGLVCLHTDNDKSNNHISNLSIGTYSKNNKDAYSDGLISSKKGSVLHGKLSRNRVDWGRFDLPELLEENRNILTKVAKIIGCSDNALKKRMKKVGIL